MIPILNSKIYVVLNKLIQKLSSNPGLKKIKFKKVIIGISSLSFSIALILLILPLWPKISYMLNKPDPNKLDYPVSFPGFKINLNTKPIPKENRLIIPKIGVDSEILEDESLDILTRKEGVWREPGSENPESDGNMVIAGHRFQYLPPNTNTFYNLEEIKDGDKIVVYWKEKSYVYEVYTTENVFPEEVRVRDNNSEIQHEITIYTCTPLYTSEKRFVVKAKLIS